MHDEDFGDLVLQRNVDDTVTVLEERGNTDRLLCSVDLVEDSDVLSWVHRPDGLLQFDTAGEFVYRPVGYDERRPDCYIVERVRP